MPEGHETESSKNWINGVESMWVTAVGDGAVGGVLANSNTQGYTEKEGR